MPRPPFAFLVAACLTGCTSESRAPDPQTHAAVAPDSSISTLQSAIGSSPSHDSIEAAVCRNIHNSYDCAQAIEAALLPLTTRVSRTGRTLTIRLSSGDSVQLRDSVVDDALGIDADQGYSYSYAGYSAPLDAHIVEVQLYEGGAFYLVSRHGTKRPLAGIPVLSPDSRRFAVTSIDLEAQYSPTLVEVWGVRSDSVVLEWRLEPLSKPFPLDVVWGPRSARWLGNDTIEVRTTVIDEYADHVPGRAVYVVRADSGWILSGSPK